MTDLTIGQRIAQERKKLNISQVGLATRLDVSRQAISKWESDAAIPEIDKLITLSRLFGVSVGWLLGVENPGTSQPLSENPSQNEAEEPAASRAEVLTEDQFRIVEALVKKYQTPPKPHLTAFHYLFAIGTSLLIFLFLYGTTSRLEKQILMYEANITALDQRLEMLEAAPQTASAPGQLLAGYSFDLYPLTKTKNTHRVKVSFSAIPNVWNKEDTGYLCISGGDGNTEPVRTACSWENGLLTSEVTLDVANGYKVYFTVERPGGSQEQQILEDSRIQHLGSECAIPMRVIPGSFAYRDGDLVLTDYTANFTMPSIYENQNAEPSIIYCEYRLYRRPQKDSQYQLIRADVMDQLVESTLENYRYQASGKTVQFKHVDIQDCNHIRLTFYVQLSSGVEGEIPITILIPDGNGGLTE